MNEQYIYEGGDESPTTSSLAKALPEGDYKFVVSEFSEPYLKDNGRWVARAKLTILKDDKQPGGQWVFANPWSGLTNDGKRRDGIGTFLKAINRAPKVGATPNWDDIINARGQCHLTVKVSDRGVMQGKEVNEVGWFITPKELDQLPENRMTMPRKEYIKELDQTEDEEDSIPF